MMFFKHVLRTFGRQKLSVGLLGVLLVVSGFIYTVMSLSVASVQNASEAFFDTSNQEDVVVQVSPFVGFDEAANAPCDVAPMTALSALYAADQACFEALLAVRLDVVSDATEGMDWEWRFHKDGFIDPEGKRHRARILLDNNTINVALIESGTFPDMGEVAVSRTYARLNDIDIGDSVRVGDATYTISGFVLFPDYNLPIFEHLFAFDSAVTTPMAMHEDDFHAFPSSIGVVLSGVGEKTHDALEHALQDTTFVTMVIMTENNPRSGAIYAELDGSQAMGLFLSIAIASIGMIIVGIMVAKTISDDRRALGVFKSMGTTTREIITPYVVAIGVFAVLTLTLGALLGAWVAPWMRGLYLRFYLLPEGDIVYRVSDAMLGIALPTLVVLGLSIWRLEVTIGDRPVAMVAPVVAKPRPVKRAWMRRIINRFHVLTRLQVALLMRQWMKVAVYVFGVSMALYLVFISLSMRGVFDRTMHDYYGNHRYESVVQCDIPASCDANGHERGLTLEAHVAGEQATIIGLEPTSTLYPLVDRRGNNLLDSLEDGLIISRSFQDLSRLRVGDTVTISWFGGEVDVDVIAITDGYPGAHVYVNRVWLSEQAFGRDDVFNRLYTEETASDDAGDFVWHRRAMMSQLEELNTGYRVMIMLMVGASLSIAVIVVYLLSVLTVEGRSYEMSLFKVLGYEPREISRVILGGYTKVNLILFVVMVPMVVFSFMWLRRYFLEWFGMYFPLYVVVVDVIVAAVLFALMSLFGQFHAKKKIARYSLQEAMKRYQV